MPPRSVRQSPDCSIIALDKFIQATRDSGYEGTASAVSELVDNSIQAGAKAIEIRISPNDDESSLELSVLDDGCGMDLKTLRQALRFGGSTRFGDRTGLGRYGMGLPNASLSQARRVVVQTWQSPPRSRGQAGGRKLTPARFSSYLDVDEILRGDLVEVPASKEFTAKSTTGTSPSGTLVRWVKCDRLDNRRKSTIARKLDLELGRRFRHYLWGGLQITVNGERVIPHDPLYLHPKSKVSGAKLFGDELRYEIRADPSSPASTGWVRVRFSELPVHDWHRLSNQDKRQLGISKGAGVSVIRAGREVDHGWFFMGAKHRENYDDWWRCEIQFDPALDEAFGITHTKQRIRPQAHLIDALTPDIEATARALNARARKAHLAVKTEERFSEAERVAAARDKGLKPLPNRPSKRTAQLMKDLERAHPELRRAPGATTTTSRYRILEASVTNTSFFCHASDGERLVLVLNPQHPFYRDIYKPLIEAGTSHDSQLRAKLELLLLAAARSEATSKDEQALERYRAEWSDTLAAFLNH